MTAVRPPLTDLLPDELQQLTALIRSQSPAVAQRSSGAAA